MYIPHYQEKYHKDDVIKHLISTLEIHSSKAKERDLKLIKIIKSGNKTYYKTYLALELAVELIDK